MTTHQNNRTYLDSSVYLAFLKGETIQAANGMTRVELARRILGDAETGDVQIFTSAITIVEVRRVGGSPQPNVLQAVLDVLDRTDARLVAVDRSLALRAQSLANDYDIRTMDAIHVASADFANCNELFMWDDSVVRKIARNPLPRLRVCEPYWRGQVRPGI